MELRIAAFEFSSPAAPSPAPLRAGSTTRRPFASTRFVFVTCAVEIEGDAPLIAFAEPADD